MEASKYLISLFFTGLLRQPMAASQRRMIDNLCTTGVNSSPKSGASSLRGAFELRSTNWQESQFGQTKCARGERHGWRESI